MAYEEMGVKDVRIIWQKDLRYDLSEGGCLNIVGNTRKHRGEGEIYSTLDNS